MPLGGFHRRASTRRMRHVLAFEPPSLRPYCTHSEPAPPLLLRSASPQQLYLASSPLLARVCGTRRRFASTRARPWPRKPGCLHPRMSALPHAGLPPRAYVERRAAASTPCTSSRAVLIHPRSRKSPRLHLDVFPQVALASRHDHHYPPGLFLQQLLPISPDGGSFPSLYLKLGPC
ncbi:hypothetical protein D1007_01664 [Hordeum vulgare]|nr:hypothetical protein D1007_01664 [Hordeum vulgare]